MEGGTRPASPRAAGLCARTRTCMKTIGLGRGGGAREGPLRARCGEAASVASATSAASSNRPRPRPRGPAATAMPGKRGQESKRSTYVRVGVGWGGVRGKCVYVCVSRFFPISLSFECCHSAAAVGMVGYSGPPAAASSKPWVKICLPDGSWFPSLRIFCSLGCRLRGACAKRSAPRLSLIKRSEEQPRSLTRRAPRAGRLSLPGAARGQAAAGGCAV